MNCGQGTPSRAWPIIATVSVAFGVLSPGQAASTTAPTDRAPVEPNTVILSDPGDPYHVLANEIARRDAVPIAHSLEQAVACDPTFLLWVVSPSRLSDRAVIDFGLTVRGRRSAISTGIISGSTLDKARALWQRASRVRARRVVTANAANPSGHIEAGITVFDGDRPTSLPLTKANLIDCLRSAHYLTFTGHGGHRSWGLAPGVKLCSADIPPLPPIVIGTASCNAFRIWEPDSIALAFTDQGAAVYAGFAYSPNEGYLIGEFRGVPFRHTWPGFPIGHIVQVQNRGTLQGFARVSYYFLLGDPRIALESAPPWRLVDDRQHRDTRTLTYTGAPAGFIPVRVARGAAYGFVRIPGVASTARNSPFYNSRLQMADVGHDKYVLFSPRGGDFTVQLRAGAPWHWMLADLITDSLDQTLICFQGAGGDVVSLVPAGIVLLVVLLVARRRRGAVRGVVRCVLVGAVFAALHGLYALVRVEHVTVTSKHVAFSPLTPVGTFVLVACGAFLFLNARSRRAKATGWLVATFSAWSPMVFVLVVLGLANVLLRWKLGAALYNHSLALMAMITFVLECVLLAAVLIPMRRSLARTATDRDPPVPG